jgi:signal transduction histidine kinase
MTDAAPRMHPFWLRFSDAELEAAFRMEQARRGVRHIRIAFLCAAVSMVVLSVMLHLFAMPMSPHPAGGGLRIFAFLAVTGLFFAFTYTEGFSRHHQVITAGLVSAFPVVAVTAEPIPRPGPYLLPGLLVLLVIHIFNAYTNLRLRFPFATFVGWFTAAFYAVYVAGSGRWPGQGLAWIGFFLVGANVFGMLSSYQMERYLRGEYVALRQREEAEREARRARDLAEAATRAKSEFLASMSHELRTPLNAIIGFSDVLSQGMFGDMNEKQTEYSRDILSSGQHLLSLINDILDLSKIEAGRMELEVTNFHLPQAIDDAMLLMRERAARRGIGLDRQIDERLGEIRGDQRKVKQILLNLLSNAVKFTPESGHIGVRAALVERTAEISVTDTGIGIAPEDQEAVFEEFKQVGTTSKKIEGTGLGLALCRKFVELHGGKIWVKSQPGQGSTFTFTLPVAG